MAVRRDRGPRSRGHTALRETGPSIRHDSPAAGGVRFIASSADGFGRRAFDIIAACTLIVIGSPILALSALAVLLFSGRPVLFGHTRVGRNGVPFRCWKLRTMLVGAEDELARSEALRSRYVANGHKLAIVEDPRVTAVGAILRRTYLDEIPQLFNVIGGTMSIIGPRPVTLDQLHEWGPRAMELITVKPGIVGAWTALGRSRPKDAERFHMELDYVRNRTLFRDLIILCRSFPVIVRGLPEDA
jgi:exopolysaccharide production protein ExoY